MKRTFVLLNSENIPQGVFTFNIGDNIIGRIRLCVSEGYDAHVEFEDKVEIGEFDYEIYFTLKIMYDEEDSFTEDFKLLRTENY